MSPELYLDYDIETASADNIDGYLNELDVKPRGNLKDPGKIEKDIELKLAKHRALAPLSWWMSKPIVICCYDEFDGRYYTFNDADPKLLLQKFCTLLVREFPNHILCGKNSQTFDNPCVTGWLIKYDLGVPDHFKRHIRGPLTDIDQIFGMGSMAQQRTTLDNYAYGMGIQQKTMNGAGVGDLYRSYLMGLRPEGMDELVDYCKQDVKITSEMRRRFLKPFTPLKIESEVDSVVDLANVF